MRKISKAMIISALMMILLFGMSVTAFASETEPAAAEAVAAVDNGVSAKAIAAGIAVAVAAAAGAIAMGMSIAKSSDAIARQPEAAGNIRTSLMLGLVFIETAIIYALVVAILIIFVL